MSEKETLHEAEEVAQFGKEVSINLFKAVYNIDEMAARRLWSILMIAMKPKENNGSSMKSTDSVLIMVKRDPSGDLLLIRNNQIFKFVMNDQTGMHDCVKIKDRRQHIKRAVPLNPELILNVGGLVSHATEAHKELDPDDDQPDKK